MSDSTHLPGHAALSSMTIHHRDGWVRTDDGLRLFEQSWAPASPKAVVVLVHGFAEHSSRHASTSLHMARRGYAIQTLDLRGHGRSEGKRCFVLAFDEYLDDTRLLLLSARERWPGRPIFLLGHSLGGLIVSLFCIDRPTELSGLILSAPAVKLGRDYSPSKIIACLALGRMFPRLPTVRLRGSSLSRDPSVVRAYDEDELVFHGRIPARTASETVRAIRRLQANVKRISVPLLVMHGSHDQVTECEGSKAFCERVPSTDKSFRIWAGLWHEIMHEPEKDAILQQMTDWLDERTPD